MTVLVGHPAGSPFAHHAALTYLELGHLESLCIPWMPSPALLKLLSGIAPLRSLSSRFSRRHFAPLAASPKVEGRLAAIGRFLGMALGGDHERIIDASNQWLMRTMTRECRRKIVTAIHAYEDCSLMQFAEAKRLGKACIYDLPIGYFAAWDETQAELARRFPDWLPTPSPARALDRRPRKSKELELADIVLVPSAFVAGTVRRFHPDKTIAVTPYGVDLTDWVPAPRPQSGPLTFLFAGQCSLRKGAPLLLEAWRAAGLKDARLQLVGPWQMNRTRLQDLPPLCSWTGPVSAGELRRCYQAADVFVFPTYFEGRALVIAEALASGLPVITTEASGATDLITHESGRLIPTGGTEALVEALRWFDGNRDRIPAMSRGARIMAETSSWNRYRLSVAKAVAPFT